MVTPKKGKPATLCVPVEDTDFYIGPEKAGKKNGCDSFKRFCDSGILSRNSKS